MILFPAIDIRNGKCVRLVQGDYAKEKIYEESPVDAAKYWEQQGAAFLHIVDLDGAKTGSTVNRTIIREIARTLNIPVQVGGGIRSMKTIDDYMTAGVNRVIIGTASIHDKEFLQRAVARYSDKVAVSIDARNGFVATDGWVETSDVKALDLVNEMEQLGVQTIIYTDILKDGMLRGPNFAELDAVNAENSIQVIASGGISSKDDIQKLDHMNLYGAIIGKALYDGRLSFQSLKEADDDAH